MLKYRLLTAIVAVPLLLLALFKLSPHGFMWLIVILIVLASHEWASLSSIRARWGKIAFILAVILIAILSAYVTVVFQLTLLLALIFWCWLAIAVIAYQVDKSPLWFQTRCLRVVSGLFILPAGWWSLMIMRWGDLRGPGWLLYALVLVWGVDSGAYFMGRFLGHSLLIPRVSPKKTWQGVWGGLIAAVIVFVIGYYCLPQARVNPLSFIVLTLISVIFCIFGDLAISLLKRIAGLKDTGVLFPGHGGLLDRLDSVLPTLLLFAGSAAVFHV